MLVLAGLVIAAAYGGIQLNRQQRQEVAEADERLRYAVPTGQDPDAYRGLETDSPAPGTVRFVDE